VPDFSVGPGVAASIAEHNDEARSDELFVILTPGEKVSQTMGRDAVYYWLEHDNAVRRSPF
jgi:hypothetical protein